MKIGELAERAGMATSAIRYYERMGLLPKAARGANGYREYPEAVLERLNVIVLGQSLGFTLETMRNIMALEGERLKDGLLQGLSSRLDEIDKMMQTLQAQRAGLLEAEERLRASWARNECAKY
jgi:DNA-binding transcriptional MerR regulator